MNKTISLLLCLLMLTGCTKFNANTKAVVSGSGEESAAMETQSAAASEAESAPQVEQSAQAQESAQELPQSEEESPYLTLSPEDAFEEAYAFAVEESGSYRFQAEQDDEGLSWEVYVLEEEFDEALRYIPQANDPVATLSGGEEKEVTVQADEMVYCFCSVNNFTDDNPAQSGGLDVYFTPAQV